MTIGTLAARIMADASGIKSGMGLARDELRITRQAFVDSTSDLDKHNTALAKVESAYEKGALTSAQYERAVKQVNKEFSDKAIAEYSEKTIKLGENMRRTGTYIAAAAGAATASLVVMGKGFLDAYAEQEAADASLTAAMSSNGTMATATMNRYKAFASEMQRLTTTGDEAALGMIQRAETLGVSGKAAENATRNAIGLGAALGVETDAAMKMSVALEQGDTTLLNRYIPALKAIKDPAERAAFAQNMLGNMFSTAEAQAKTFAGQMTQTTNLIGDQKEEFGRLLADALTPFVAQAKAAVVSFGGMDDSTRKLIVSTGLVAAGLGTVVTLAGTAVAAAGQLTIWYGALTATTYGAVAAQVALGAAMGAGIVAAGALAVGAGYAIGAALYDMTEAGQTANRVLGELHDSIQSIANIDMSGSTQDGLEQFIEATNRQIEKIKEHNQELASQQAWYNGWQANADIIAANNEQLDVLNANLNKAVKEQNDLNAAQQASTLVGNDAARKAFEDSERAKREQSRLTTEQMKLDQEELLDDKIANTGTSYWDEQMKKAEDAVKEMDPFVKKIEDANKATEEAIKRVQEESDTYGMTATEKQAYADAAEVARLEEMGASAEQISHLKELQSELAEAKRRKDALKETSVAIGAGSMAEAFDIMRQNQERTPMVDRYAGIGEAIPATAEQLDRFAGIGEAAPAKTDERPINLLAGVLNVLQQIAAKEGITVEEVSL